MAVRVTNSQKKVRVAAGSLRARAEAALSLLGLKGAEVSVLVTGDRKMRTLNREYRGMDRTTDVLSFSMLEGGELGAACLSASCSTEPGPPLMLGDIVISASRAELQAAEAGHSTDDEMTFLLVHGLLHLAGYDHETGAADRRKMFGRQKAVIKALAGL